MNVPYNNPFMWCAMRYDDIAAIIRNWGNINWDNIDLNPANLLPVEYKLFDVSRRKSYYISVDNKFNICYVHYRQSTTHSKPCVQGVDVYYNKIWEYVVDKYRDRVSRMQLNNERPVFYLMKTRMMGLSEVSAIDRLCGEYGFECVVAHNASNGTLDARNIIEVDTDEPRLCARQAIDKFRAHITAT